MPKKTYPSAHQLTLWTHIFFSVAILAPLLYAFRFGEYLVGNQFNLIALAHFMLVNQLLAVALGAGMIALKPLVDAGWKGKGAKDDDFKSLWYAFLSFFVLIGFIYVSFDLLQHSYIPLGEYLLSRVGINIFYLDRSNFLATTYLSFWALGFIWGVSRTRRV